MKEQDFLKTRLNFAVVLRCDIEEIQRIKTYLSQLQVEVIYQKISGDKLIIKEGERRRV